MDVDALLIAKAVHTSRYDVLMSAGVEPQHFEREDLRELWKYVTEHLRTYRSAPSFDAVRLRHPNVNLESSQDSIEFILDLFMRDVKKRSARRQLENLAVRFRESDADYDALFYEAARQLALETPGGDVGRLSEMHNRIALYNAKKQIGVSPGIMYGVPEFDAATMGIQPHEFITVAGFSGAGKSTLVQYFALQAFLQGKRILVMSGEMDRRTLMQRWDVMQLGFAYQSMKKLELAEDQINQWQKLADETEERARDQGADIYVMDRSGGLTVDTVFAGIQRYQPDLVVIDYLGLMSVHGFERQQGWEKTQYLTRELKRICLSQQVPIIAAAQSGRDAAQHGARMDNIGASISIIQDSDISFGLDQTKYDETNKRMTVNLLKNRDGYSCTAEMLWDPGHMRFGPWDAAMAYLHPITGEVQSDPTSQSSDR